MKKSSSPAEAVKLEVRTTSKKGNGLVTQEDIQQDARILQFVGRLGTDRETSDNALKVAENLFLDSPGGMDDHINHSCWPNARIDWDDQLWLRATRQIKRGEEITIHYGTFAYDEVNLEKSRSFVCRCGESPCVGVFRGFRYLDREDKRRVIPVAADYVVRLFVRDLGE